MVKSIETKVSDFLGAYEKLRDAQFYPVKTPRDNLICPICGGCYKRRDKSKHSRGKKHINMLDLVLTNKVHPYLDWADITHQEYDNIIENTSSETSSEILSDTSSDSE